MGTTTDDPVLVVCIALGENDAAAALARDSESGQILFGERLEESGATIIDGCSTAALVTYPEIDTGIPAVLALAEDETVRLGADLSIDTVDSMASAAALAAVHAADFADVGTLLVTENVTAISPVDFEENFRARSDLKVKRGRDKVAIFEWSDGDDLTVPATHAPDATERRAVLRREDDTWTIDARRPLMSFGRSSKADVLVDDERASRIHAEIEYRSGHLYLVDKSTNGTYVTGAGERLSRVHQAPYPIGGRGFIEFGRKKGTGVEYVVQERAPGEKEWRDVTPEAEPTDPGRSIFQKEGEFWTIAHGGQVLRLKDAKGLRYIAWLLDHPGQEFLALDLVQTVGEGGKRAKGAVSEKAKPEGGVGPLLDPQAKAAYRKRVEELRAELEEAEGFGDIGRAENARAELDAISQQLSQAVGLGGRDRETGSDAERARVVVTVRVKSSLTKIRKGHPDLGEWLTGAIKTGRYCSYAPPEKAPIDWTVVRE